MSADRPRSMNSLTIAEEVDALCDHYEDALRRGEAVDLTAWLPADGQARGAALVQLVRVELEHRLAAGESATVEEYLVRYPELRDDPAALTLLQGVAARPAFDPTVRQREEAAAPPAGATPLSGERTAAVVIPGYEVLGELGRGGMGVVYKARHSKLNRIVALKMLLAGGHADEAELRRFRTEAEALARLQHPNIVQVHEVGEHEGKPFFALEYCPGGGLDKKLNATPLSAAAAAKLVETLARAVHAAHRQNVVHRDLKPANVLLAADGAPKVTDFGLAKKLDEAGQTQTGAVMGTPSYMAPEQARGLSKEVGPATDVYALGAILYECLTGRPPFKAATVMETLRQVTADEPAPPRRLQSRTPRDLETICLKSLEKEPRKRYRSAEELADDLRRFQAGEPIAARPVGTIVRAVKWARRRPAVTALLAATATAVVLGLAGVSWEWLRAEGTLVKESDARRTAEESLRREQAQNYLNRIGLAERDLLANNADRAEATLDACPESLRHWEWRYLKRLCHPELLVLSGHDGMVNHVAFSPNRRLLACATSTGSGADARGEVRLWDLTTEKVVRRYTGHPEAVDDVAFCSDGRRIASHSLLGLVKVWDATTGEDLWSLGPWKEEGNDVKPERVAWSPDGRLLAVACTVSHTVRLGVAPDYLGGVILLRDVAAGREERRFRMGLSEVASLAFSPDGKALAAAGKNYSARLASVFEVGVWEAATGTQRLTLPGRQCVAFSPDGKRLAAAGENAVVRVWDAADGREAFSCTGHGEYLMAVAFYPDGKYLVSAGADRGIKVWDARNGREAFTLRGHTTTVVGLAFHPDGRRLASCAWDNDVRVWDVAAPPEGVALRTEAGHARDLAFDQEGGRLAYVQTDQSIDEGSPLSSEGDTLRTGPSPEAVTVWDAASGKVARNLKGRAWAVAWSPDGRRLAVASRNDVRICNARTGTEEKVLHGAAMITALAFSPDGKRLASSERGRVRVWDVEAGREEPDGLADAPAVVWSLAWSDDGRRIAAAGEDKTVHLWDAATGKPLRTFRGHTEAVLAVAFAPGGARVASAGWDDVIRVWEADTGREVLTLAGHTQAVLCLAFSDDGRRLASGARDKTVKLWDLDAGQEVLTLRGHTERVNGVAFSPGGKWLASAGEDGQVRVWGAAPVPASEP